MKFMEAKRILAAFEGGPSLEFLLGMSGQPEPLQPFLAAAAAERGLEAQVRTLPFNTLAQTLHQPPLEGEREVFLLLPWDLVREADWRSGFPETPPDLPKLMVDARQVIERVRRRNRPALLYLDAAVPGIFPDHHASSALPHHLRATAVEAGARVIAAEASSLENLLRSGSPLAAGALGMVAREIVAVAVEPPPARGKVLVTDFDNTLWRGVVGEDGVAGLEFGPTGLGFTHFIYQTFLKHVKAAGVILAGVTRNDQELALAPLKQPECVLAPEDFVGIVASYNPKSSQIEELARHLNLGLESFLFVDDNPVELAEVGQKLPGVQLAAFPAAASDVPEFFSRLSAFFHREGITPEDRVRTEMYRTRLAGLVPKEAEGADLTHFLGGLQMRLTIRDRSTGDRERAIQLINKTNQFNLNGVRRSDEEVAAVLEAGGRLYTASLSDLHGNHGEILACLVGPDDTILSLVLSCRVFQRRVERAFLIWLSERLSQSVCFAYVETERNEPFRRFIQDPAFDGRADGVTADLRAYARAHRAELELFDIEGP